MARYHSEKREAIYEAIAATKEHPTADYVYGKLKEQYPSISLGTIYRNISQLKEQQKLISVGVVQGQERFDANTADHPHFVCNECGQVIDVDGLVMDESNNEVIKARYGAQPTGCLLVYNGLCRECLEKK